MEKVNCSRCGTKVNKNKIKKVAEFNVKGLKSANLCEECYKWWQTFGFEGKQLKENERIETNAKRIMYITFGVIFLLILINGLVFGWDKNGFFHLGLNFINPPCFYYLSDYEIKLYGLNESVNHSVFVTQIPGYEPIVYDNATIPSTNIPLCEKENKTKIN